MRPCFICNSMKNVSKIYNLYIHKPNDIPLNSEIDIYYCKECYFYYSDNQNNQEDYNNYYLNFNNYSEYVISPDKDEKCFKYITKHINNIKSILDYGCGNKIISKLLKTYYSEVDIYDINMSDISKKYDCIVISHVLEHIYDIDSFINKIFNITNDNGYIYIEIPNAEFYEKFIENGPLQEINMEHINFFSKYSLVKLMIKHNYTPFIIEDDFFTLNSNKYYIIRGIFKKISNNNSFEKYLQIGINQINEIQIPKINNLYIYGCGQFLYKIFNKFKHSKIINIIDDNSCYLDKHIENYKIINFEIAKNKIKEDDTIFITTIISANKIIEKLKNLNIKINIYYINSNMQITKI